MLNQLINYTCSPLKQCISGEKIESMYVFFSLFLVIRAKPQISNIHHYYLVSQLINELQSYFLRDVCLLDCGQGRRITQLSPSTATVCHQPAA